MKRILLVLLAAGLVLAPAAAAKGPHAILTTPREAIEAGKPWEVTVELNEFRRAPHIAMTGRLGDRTVGGKPVKVPASMTGAAGYKVTMVFPEEGRWRLRLYAGHERFVFPAVDVGGTSVPQDYVAFPIGSEAARQGAGGPYITNEAPAPAPAAPKKVVEKEEEGGLGFWMLPLLGVVLAGAGVAAVRRRGSR